MSSTCLERPDREPQTAPILMKTEIKPPRIFRQTKHSTSGSTATVVLAAGGDERLLVVGAIEFLPGSQKTGGWLATS